MTEQTEQSAAQNAGNTDVPARESGIEFVTANASAEERAAVIAVLTELRTEETLQVKKVARRANEPWRRSQRTPEGIHEFTE